MGIDARGSAPCASDRRSFEAIRDGTRYGNHRPVKGEVWEPCLWRNPFKAGTIVCIKEKVIAYAKTGMGAKYPDTSIVVTDLAKRLSEQEGYAGAGGAPAESIDSASPYLRHGTSPHQYFGLEWLFYSFDSRKRGRSEVTGASCSLVTIELRSDPSTLRADQRTIRDQLIQLRSDIFDPQYEDQI